MCEARKNESSEVARIRASENGEVFTQENGAGPEGSCVQWLERGGRNICNTISGNCYLILETYLHMYAYIYIYIPIHTQTHIYI